MTKLKEYLFYKNITITDFAKLAGMSRAYMSKITLGLERPSKLLAREIERLTNGEVKAEDMRKPE